MLLSLNFCNKPNKIDESNIMLLYEYYKIIFETMSNEQIILLLEGKMGIPPEEQIKAAWCYIAKTPKRHFQEARIRIITDILRTNGTIDKWSEDLKNESI